MPSYVAPLRDMHFVIHELLDVEATFKNSSKYAEVDKDTINQVLEEAGKFCINVFIFSYIPMKKLSGT